MQAFTLAVRMSLPCWAIVGLLQNMDHNGPCLLQTHNPHATIYTPFCYHNPLLCYNYCKISSHRVSCDQVTACAAARMCSSSNDGMDGVQSIPISCSTIIVMIFQDS